MSKKNKKQEGRYLSKQLITAGIFFISALAIEVLTFIVLGFEQLPQYLVLDVAIMLMVVGGVLIIPSLKAQRIVYYLFIIIQVVISYLNVTLYGLFGTVVTLDMINLAGEAVRAVESSVINLGFLIGAISIAILYIIINIIFAKVYNPKNESKNLSKGKFSFLMVLCFIVFQIIGNVAYITQLNSISEASSVYGQTFLGDDYSLHNTLLFEAEGLKKFGTYAFYFQDINTTLFSLDNDKAQKIEEVNTYLSEGEVSPVGTYSGVSAGNNVIVVMAESLEWYAIDPVLTPTLYAMSQDNVSANNYYSKSKTNISETFGFLGSYPLAQSFSSILPGVSKLNENDFSYSLPNLLREEGYTGLNYLINHEKDFYKRSTTHPAFGFTDIFDISDFEENIEDSEIVDWGDWSLDSQFFKGAMDSIVPETGEAPFFNWVTTMSMHGPYEGNHRMQSYVDTINASGWDNWLAGTEDEEHLLNYMADVMDLDKAMEYLFTDLEEKEILDTTTVVLFSDHETYYHGLGATAKGIAKEDYTNPELYRVPFMIYDSNLPSIQVSDFSAPYDIMPTIMDILGIKYNKNMYMGNSIVNENEQSTVFLSLTGGILNKNLFTTNGSEIISNTTGTTQADINEFNLNMEDLIQKILMFNDMYNYNLFDVEAIMLEPEPEEEPEGE
jgi:phosphoglycerol transferase MdoB-like AlkP superfamily enzyme